VRATAADRDLLVRWTHVIVGIAWIGTPFYYIALDYHLQPPREAEAVKAGVGGEAFEIHGGGFYRVDKYRVAPPTLPSPLHWFKWEAYTTWMSGFTLLIVLYYLNADTYLIDKSVADLSVAEAVARMDRSYNDLLLQVQGHASVDALLALVDSLGTLPGRKSPPAAPAPPAIAWACW